MAKRLSGKEVADALTQRLKERAAVLRAQGVVPTLTFIRLGESFGDLSYERGAERRASRIGVEIRRSLLPKEACKEDVLNTIDALNADDSVHGVLLFRPLPKHLKEYEDEICGRLVPGKDVDGMTALSAAGLYMGRSGPGFAPCTPSACMEILDYYGYDCKGKNVALIGRSLVVGRPAALMFMSRNATVTICHTKTKNTAEICRRADIIVSSAGVLGSLTKDFVREGQVVLDVSVNWDENKPNPRGGLGAFSGDAVYAEVEPVVSGITPVPGGVGAVTSSVLMKHVIEAAERMNCSV